MNKYILIGGNPFKNGYTGLSIIGSSNSEDAIKALWNEKYDQTGGLMMVVDIETGKEYIITW